MGSESEQQRSEPSFSDTELDELDAIPAGNPVDLDKLIAEIDRSAASSLTANTSAHRSEVLTEADGEDEALPAGRIPPEQSALDFGGDEHSYAGERVAPLPDPATTTTTSNLKGDEPMSRGVLMAGGALVALSLLCALAGLFTAFSASSRIEALQQSVDALQTRLATMQVSGDPRVGQLQGEQAGLTSRLDEMAMRLDGLATAPTSGENQLAELRKRLDALERKAAQPAKAAAATSKGTTTSAKSSGKSLASGGDWAVVLVSFATAAQAENERARLQKLGIRAEVVKTTSDGKTWYRVRVPGYGSHEGAKAAIPGIESKSGIKGAWVAQR